MRRIFFTFALLAACAAMAQDDAIKWLKTTHDFGAFDEDLVTVSASFKFVNVSAEPVAITQVASTCGCTVANYDKDEIAPGDTASIDVTYNAIGRPGRFTKQVYVRTSASHEREKLTIKGVVIGNSKSISQRYPVDMGPLKLRNGAIAIGRVNANSGKQTYVECYNQGDAPLAPTFAHVPKYLQASAEPDTIAAGDLGTINVYFRGDRCDGWGILSDSIQVIPAPDCKPYWLPVVVIVEEDFSLLTPQQLQNAPKIRIDGDRIDLGAVPEGAGKPVTAKIDVENLGKDPLIIRRVYSQDPAVTVRMSSDKIKGGKKGQLIVEFDPAKQPKGVINTRLTLIANDPSHPTVTLRIVGDRSR